MMNDIDIKSLWKGQQAPVADLSVIRKKIKRFRLRRIGEAYAVITLMILAIVFGAIIWICWTPLLTVTKMGIILLSIGFMLPALSYGRLLRLYYRLKIDSTNIDYIDNLLRIKKREYRQQHLILNLYFFFLSIGFALYGYEYTFFHSFYWGIIAYSILLLWIALNWFVLRPRIIRKRKHKFYDFMRYIESHREQLFE